MQVLEDPADVRLALIFLRVLCGWNQTELAERAGINKSLISLYELEKQAPSGKTFSRLLSAFHIPASTFETVLRFVQIVRGMVKGSEEEDTEFITSLASVMATTVRISVSHSLAGMLAPGPEPLPEELSCEPPELGEQLRRSTPSAQKALVRDLREYHTWGFCEWLCQEAEGSLETDVTESLRLAELAVDVAARVPEGETPRRRLQGYAWAHLARARRAAGDLPGTEEAVTRAMDLWEACGPDDSDFGLAERFLDLVAG
jgi:transcriptional regulator with XRE-family HTH domain